MAETDKQKDISDKRNRERELDGRREESVVVNGLAVVHCISLSVASDHFDFGDLNAVYDFSELGVFNHKGPDIVAESVCVEFAFESDSVSYFVRESVVDCFVELFKNFLAQTVRDRLLLDQFVE